MADPNAVTPPGGLVAQQQPASPTGIPIIPPAATPYIAGAVAVAATLSQVLPANTIAAKVFSLIAMFGGLLGIGSPGWRRQP